jgi:hypothetical protein
MIQCIHFLPLHRAKTIKDEAFFGLDPQETDYKQTHPPLLPQPRLLTYIGIPDVKEITFDYLYTEILESYLSP